MEWYFTWDYGVLYIQFLLLLLLFNLLISDDVHVLRRYGFVLNFNIFPVQKEY